MSVGSGAAIGAGFGERRPVAQALGHRGGGKIIDLMEALKASLGEAQGTVVVIGDSAATAKRMAARLREAAREAVKTQLGRRFLVVEEQLAHGDQRKIELLVGHEEGIWLEGESDQRQQPALPVGDLDLVDALAHREFRIRHQAAIDPDLPFLDPARSLRARGQAQFRDHPRHAVTGR